MYTDVLCSATITYKNNKFSQKVAMSMKAYAFLFLVVIRLDEYVHTERPDNLLCTTILCYVGASKLSLTVLRGILRYL